MLGIFGTKLRIHRENLGLTQEEFAKAVGLSSEFISHLELGRRKPSLETLKAIADFLIMDIASFLEEKEPAFDKLLRQKNASPKTIKEFKKFMKYCDDYLKLEEVTDRRLELAPAYSHTPPERLALEERRRLGLGDAPIRDIFALVELNGMRVLRQAIAPECKITGVFFFWEVKEAAFALINSSQSVGDQVFTVAHEYFHFLRDRFTEPVIDNPDVFVDEYVSLYHPREKFAHLFAKRLLMPATKIQAVIEKDLCSQRLKYEDVIYLKRYFGVSTRAMLRTLGDMEYLSYSQVKDFENRDPVAFEKALYGKPSTDEIISKGKTIPSDRFKNLAVLVSREEKTDFKKEQSLA